jgi:AraC family transcriptional regulator of adaptative response/methylated-DNA-[protein]-cysteine methyltransferase
MHPLLAGGGTGTGAPDGEGEPRGGYHYGIIARAIRTIAARAPEPVPLGLLAREAGMGEAHFQRVFSRWAGVSPTRFGRFLALDRARRALAERRSSLLDAALAAGLSGPGRLHDLFVTWEAMTPGAFARGGAGLAIAWDEIETPFGPAVAMATERGLCGLGFAGAAGAEAARADLAARWPRASFRRDPDAVAPHVDTIFEARPRRRPLRLHLIGGPFQIKVWEALLRVGEGEVTSYGALARAIGHPGAARAVGSAIGGNPVAWLVPCHRVLREAGGLGGYRWGLDVKRMMLAVEAARCEAADDAERRKLTRA